MPLVRCVSRLSHLRRYSYCHIGYLGRWKPDCGDAAVKIRSVFFIIALFWMGCASQSSSFTSPESAQQVKYYHHTVTVSGETLGIIAGWYTGDMSNWRTILSHNKGLDVQRIQIGDTVKIPENLLVRRKPLPEKQVAMYNLRQIALSDRWQQVGFKEFISKSVYRLRLKK